MKNAPVLKAAPILCALILLAGQTIAMATENTYAGTKILSGDRTVENWYNSFNVCYQSSQKSTTCTETSKDGQTSTVTTTTTTEMEWMGGSVKATISKTISDSSSADGATSHAESTTTHLFDADGKLLGASGSTTTTGTAANGDQSTSTTVDTYELKYGDPILTQSVTNQTTTKGGQVSDTATSTRTYQYELLGGQMRKVSETSVTHSESPETATTAKTTTDTVTTTKYVRNAEGVITNMTQTMSGESVAIGENNSRYVSKLSAGDYVATFTFDEDQGWYMSYEKQPWTQYVAA